MLRNLNAQTNKFLAAI